MTPRYLKAYKSGRLQEAAKIFSAKLTSCDICPRNCRINRTEEKKGFCRTGSNAIIYSVMPHFGEEPGISGESGSGTIFFSNCNLRCIYCQNYKFSHEDKGREVDALTLSRQILSLQNSKCHNINFVTPSHVIPQILNALILAIDKGLNIPLVYNSSGYDTLESIKLLDGIFDIYLPDARYDDPAIALKYSQSPDYPKINKTALKEMHRQVGVAKFNKDGIIEEGLIIRHLVLPGNLSGTDNIMRFIARELNPDTFISLMSQYYPYFKAKDYPEISRRVTSHEYQNAIDCMAKYGLHNGWIQEDNGEDSLAGVHIKENY